MACTRNNEKWPNTMQGFQVSVARVNSLKRIYNIQIGQSGLLQINDYECSGQGRRTRPG